MNFVNLIGRLARITDLSDKFGKPYVTFVIAVHTSKDYTDFIKCTAINETANNVLNYFKTGDPIGVSGSWHTSQNTDEDGVTTYYNSCSVNRIYFLPSNKPKTNE